MNGPILVDENGESTDLVLSHEERIALVGLRLAGEEQAPIFRLRPGGRRDTYRIVARSIVGSVSVAGLQVTVRPKCGIANLSFMLSRSDSAIVGRDDASNMGDGELLGYLASYFLRALELAIADGMREGYSAAVEVGISPRGSVDFGSFGSGLPLPVRYRYQRYSTDIVENRLLRHTLDFLIGLFGAANPVGAHAYLLREGFDVAPFEGDHRSVSSGTDIPEYRQCLSLASAILDAKGIDPGGGARDAPGMLFNMNRVFEEFVCEVVEKRVRELGLEADLQGRSNRVHLDQKNELHLKPDFAVFSGTRCLGIGDVKYKLRKRGASRSDLYQVFAYSELYRAKHAVLMHAGTAQPREVRFNTPNAATVYAVSVNVDGSSERLLKEIHHEVNELVYYA